MNFEQLITLGFSFFLFSCSSLERSVIKLTLTPDGESIGEFFERCPTLEEVVQVNADLRIIVE